MATRLSHSRSRLLGFVLGFALVKLAANSLPLSTGCAAESTVLWLFDEPTGTYPSSVLDSSSERDYPLVLGQGGRIVAGKFGNALSTKSREPINYPSGASEYGLKRPWRILFTDKPEMSWHNSRFAALMTDGETHLRKEVGFVNPVETQLNLGEFDWTIEFWFSPTREPNEAGTVFELGLPRENGSRLKSELVLSSDRKHFVLTNDPSQTKLSIPTNAQALSANNGVWHHLAFVYSSAGQQVAHYVDGVLQERPPKCQLKRLPANHGSYLSLGRNGQWKQPLPGFIDELRFSATQVYGGSFRPPGSFAPQKQSLTLMSGPPLLCDKPTKSYVPNVLGGRKHLFIDDALLAEVNDAKFVVNPPRRAERVIDDIGGSFRKHLTVVDDPTKVIRIYNGVERDHLAVRVSHDGIIFAAPTGTENLSHNLKPPSPQFPRKWASPENGGGGFGIGSKPTGDAIDSSTKSQVVIAEMVGGLGNPFIDPNGPDQSRWKYFSDYHRRGIYLYTSPDGYVWQRNKTATLPFRSGTQSCTFFDDQRQLYVSYHRSGIHHTPAGGTERSSVVTEHQDLSTPLEFTPLTQQEYLERQTEQRLRGPLPWYLDNGPLTPGGFGLEFPHAFRPTSEDPVGTDIYVTKAQKYPWAPDTYVAFPIVYFHYWPEGPSTRHALAHPERGRGLGPIETQLAVSRDGINWRRYPRPAYVGAGRHAGRDVVTAYIAHGMVRRGDEIWQYYFGETQYHTAYRSDRAGRGVYRLVQRLDGFVSLDSPYETETVVMTKPLTFTGNRLTLNIDTDATGYAQVGILDAKGEPVLGFSLDECIYINGDFIDTQVEWLEKSADIGRLAGETVQLVFRMRGSKLYSMQFVDR